MLMMIKKAFLAAACCAALLGGVVPTRPAVAETGAVTADEANQLRVVQWNVLGTLRSSVPRQDGRQAEWRNGLTDPYMDDVIAMISQNPGIRRDQGQALSVSAPKVLMLQEICAGQAESIARATGYHMIFAPKRFDFNQYQPTRTDKAPTDGSCAGAADAHQLHRDGSQPKYVGYLCTSTTPPTECLTTTQMPFLPGGSSTRVAQQSHDHQDYGQALLWKPPANDTGREAFAVHLPRPTAQLTDDARTKADTAVCAEFAVEGFPRKVRACSVHLIPYGDIRTDVPDRGDVWSDARKAQAQALRTVLDTRATSEPETAVVVAGDFNSNPTAHAMSLLYHSSALSNTSASTGPFIEADELQHRLADPQGTVPTWCDEDRPCRWGEGTAGYTGGLGGNAADPMNWPTKYDYIFYSEKHFAAVRGEATDPCWSDHRPLSGLGTLKP